ncbi:FMN hydroxy acid dehydrogenase domain-containing protein [Fusarium falciforme]|uniref:FMN hydroxy acid dehydrogenase domain-containing protein n=1 Tax=Fusarium falciforme TaxID=195108 RepID=UPI002300588D|nr:FMN hydroxy acid dehydrogenase domain-containing protein [Fusarium falciforme]WAO91640.1 FMN hydroxy acid dehydrogenase domain-containing protein [Fusarium falciforme]
MAFDHRLTSIDATILTIGDLKEKAGKALPSPVRDYYNKGSMDLLTVVDNKAAFDQYKLRPRNLKDVSALDTSTTFLGTKVTFPYGFSPSGQHQLAHPDREVATSKGAAMNNIPMVLSTYTSKSPEDIIAQGTGNPYMMYICFFKDRSKTLEIIKRAEAARFKAIIISIDVTALGLRLNEYRNNFKLPPRVTNVLIADPTEAQKKRPEWDPSITWEDSINPVLNPDGISLAIQHGVDGILISNHGGHQLDGVPATLDALRECAPVAKNKIKLAIDGGIRRGSDIFKALALGADFCLAGRPPLWGLAYNGADGVDLSVKILLREFRTCMALCGCKTVDEISSAHLSTLSLDGRLSRL